MKTCLTVEYAEPGNNWCQLPFKTEILPYALAVAEKQRELDAGKNRRYRLVQCDVTITPLFAEPPATQPTAAPPVKARKTKPVKALPSRKAGASVADAVRLTLPEMKGEWSTEDLVAKVAAKYPALSPNRASVYFQVRKEVKARKVIAAEKRGLWRYQPLPSPAKKMLETVHSEIHVPRDIEAADIEAA